AMREGRYVNVPPKGYRKGRDEHDRSLIQPNDDANHVREAFRLAADTELPLEVIRRRLAKAGFRCSSNQFNLLLRSPLYAGYVLIPAWRDEAEDIVKGVHEPLVDEAAYERVQRKRFAVP